MVHSKFMQKMSPSSWFFLEICGFCMILFSFIFFFGYFFKLGSRHYQPCLSSNIVSSNSLWHQFFKDANFVPFCFKFGKLLEWEYDIQLKCWLKILLVFFWVFFARGISMIRAFQIKVCHQSFMMTSRLPQCNFAWPQSIPNTDILLVLGPIWACE